MRPYLLGGGGIGWTRFDTECSSTPARQKQVQRNHAKKSGSMVILLVDESIILSMMFQHNLQIKNLQPNQAGPILYPCRSVTYSLLKHQTAYPGHRFTPAGQ